MSFAEGLYPRHVDPGWSGAQDFGREEQLDLVDQFGFEELSNCKCAAFDEHASMAEAPEMVEQAEQIELPCIRGELKVTLMALSDDVKARALIVEDLAVDGDNTFRVKYNS